MWFFAYSLSLSLSLSLPPPPLSLSPGDVSPIDVISHIPVFCEEKKVPYCYVPSRRQLGSASGTKRPTSVVLIEKDNDYEELYDKCFTEVDSLPLPL